MTEAGRSWRGWLLGLPLATLVLLMLSVILLPIGLVLVMSIWSSPIGVAGGQPSLQHYGAALADPATLPLLGNTLVLTLLAAGAATLLGMILAWIVTSTDVPFARVLYVLPMLPLLLPLLLKMTALIILFSPRIGLANIFLIDLLGLPGPVFDIYTMHGMIFALTLGTVPMAYLIFLPAMSSMNHSLEEASRVSGAGRFETLVRVVLPSIAPAIISALALSCLLVATAFETPILLGLPGGVRTYMSAIYQAITHSITPNYNLAAAESTVFLLLSGALLAWYLGATRSERRYALVTGRGYVRGRTRMGGWRWLLVALVLAYFLLAFVQIVVVTALVSLVPYYTVVNGNPFTELTTQNYRTALTSSVMRSIGNSLTMSFAVSLAGTFIVAVLALVSLKTKVGARRLIEVIATLPVALPPMVFSVALLMTILFVPGLKIAYNTPWPLLIAYIVVFLPFGMRILSSAIVQISDDLLEASRVCGASWLGSMRAIAAPLLAVALLNTILLTFILSLRELGAVVLLVTPNLTLFPAIIFGMVETGNFQVATVLNVVSAVLPLAVLAVVLGAQRVPRLIRRLRRRTAAQPAGSN